MDEMQSWAWSPEASFALPSLLSLAAGDDTSQDLTRQCREINATLWRSVAVVQLSSFCSLLLPFNAIPYRSGDKHIHVLLHYMSRRGDSK